MQKIVIFLKRSLICFLLSFSLLCNNTAAVTYQAAAIPVVFTAWEVLVTVFALLGITISIADHVDSVTSEEATQELTDAIAAWKVANGEGLGDADADGKDDIYATINPMDWIKDDKLVLPEEDLLDLKDFYHDIMAPSPTVQPMNDVDLKSMNYQEFSNWFLPYTGLDSYASLAAANNFCANLFDTLPLYDYFSVVWYNSTYNMYFFDVCKNIKGNFYIGWYETDALNSSYYRFVKSSDLTYANTEIFGEGYPAYLRGEYYKTFGSSHNYREKLYSNNSTILAVIVNGRLYDPGIFTYPINATSNLDFGSVYKLSDFVKNKNNISSNIVDVPGTVGGVDLTDKIEEGAFDVLTPGRDYDSEDKEVVGDVVLPMPSGDVLSDYQNGLITYEELLEELGVTPIDKTTGTDLITGELLDTNIGILSGIDALVDFVAGLFDGLTEMFLSLFIPADGYFEGYFTRINDFFDSRLGFLYTPFDLLIRFLSSLPSIDHSSTQLYFPGLKFQEYVLCEPMYVELDLRDEFPALYRYMYFITDTILIGAVLWLLQSKTKELIKG